MSSGSATSRDRRIDSITSLCRILGPIALILIGVALRLNTFLVNYSLSTDEAALARNLLDRPWARLIGPLDYAQLAPPGFLLVQKAIVTTYGSSEHALRLFPLVCGLVSVWLCWTVSRRLLSWVPAVCAIGLFSFNNSFIQYSAQAKQYSSDVAAALLILFFAAKLFDPSTTRRHAVWLGLAGAITVLFSFTAVFVLVGATASCWLLARSTSAPARPVLVVATACWVAGAAGGTLLGRLSLTPTDAAYMRWFWQPGFMPIPPRSLEDVLWLWYQLKKTFRWTGHYRASAGWIALAAIGAWSFARRGRIDAALLLVTPVVLVVAASAAELYPFIFGRAQLFLLPMLLMLVAEGAERCRQLAPDRVRWVGVVPLALVVVLAAQSTWSSPRGPWNGDLRSPLQRLKSAWRPDDRMYVHYQAGQVFRYYAPQFGLTETDYVLGTCSAERRAPLREVDALRGHPRVWVVTLAVDQTDVFVRYLDAIGSRLSFFDAAGLHGQAPLDVRGSVSLYDLTRPRQSASMSADNFPFPQDTSDVSSHGWGCYGVFSRIPT